MNPCFLVTQGPAEVALLRGVLGVGEDEPQIKLVAAGGWSSADSLARSVLATGRGDVALIVDAEAIAPHVVGERKHFLEWSLRSIASPARRLIVVIEPEIAAILFKDRQVVEGLVGGRVADTDLVRGEYEPRKVLGALLSNASLEEAFA